MMEPDASQMSPNDQPILPKSPQSNPAQSLALPLRPFLGSDAVFSIAAQAMLCPDVRPGSLGLVHAAHILQDADDYRGTIRAWFSLLRVGGRLMIEVPHGFLGERRLALPLKAHPGQRRIYSPAILAGEMEEALEPNSYRLRLLCDHDEGYDYASQDDPGGAQSILAVIERIESPEWQLDAGEVAGGTPIDFSFEPPWTRCETPALAKRRRIIILKLDHLGDFIMAMPALKKARAAFADAEITLVVGPWNVAMAQDLGLFDQVIGFEAFPRNSSEETVDLAARAADFKATVTGEYDLAIDLRADADTRFFLRSLHAATRAGLGTRAQFPFLDIFLPIDLSRHGFEAAQEIKLGVGGHAVVAPCRRTPYRLKYTAQAQNPNTECLVFGPYIALAPGEYLYIPDIEIEEDGDRVLDLDVACDMKGIMRLPASSDSIPRFRFVVEEPGAKFEFRIFSAEARQTPSFSYYGGRLLRRGADSVLHQSEYQALLIDLIKMRTDQFGLLCDDAGRR